MKLYSGSGLSVHFRKFQNRQKLFYVISNKQASKDSQNNGIFCPAYKIMKHFFYCPEICREPLDSNRKTSNVLTQEHLESLRYVPETHSSHSATLEVDHLLVLENSFSLATHLVCMLAMIQEWGRWGFDIIVWVLAKLPLDFLLSLGLTAVRATNSGPANRSCQRTQDSIIPVSVSLHMKNGTAENEKYGICYHLLP